jgi:hypothetical protein
MRHILLLLAFAIPSAATLQASPASIDLPSARSSMAGVWEGKLEYLDYTANEWFGIPVVTRIEDEGDGATLIRRSQFDDGPPVGIVHITTVELFDAANAKLTAGGFRKGREPDMMVYKVRFEGEPKDATHWTMIEEADAKDDNRPARLRLTTVRDGAKLQTLKQVDFQDDTNVEWLSRNRTTLTLVK